MNNEVTSANGSRLSASAIRILFIGVFAACLVDVPSLPVGSFSLKIAYAVIPVVVLILAMVKNSIKKSTLIVSLAFVCSLLPSLAFSYNLTGSIAYLYGALVSVSIMGVMGFFARQAGTEKVIAWLVRFYRFAIFISALLYVFRLQERAHFTLYEPSYFAISLIPYLSITLVALYTQRKKPWKDLALIVVAVVTTESASLVFWCVFVYVFAWFKYSKHKIRSAIVACVLIVISATAIVKNNDRAGDFYDLLTQDATVPILAINLAGNRFQRMMTASDIFERFPWTGVGMNALKIYSGEQLRATDYQVEGTTAADFDTSLPAINAYLEIAAEAGVIGLAGYLVVLMWVARRPGTSNEFRALKIAFYVTSIALLIESSYLRSYVWALYGLIVGLSLYEHPRRRVRGSRTIVAPT